MSLPVIVTMVLLMLSHELLATRSSCLRSHGSLFHPSQHHTLTGHSFLNQSGTVRTQCMMLCVRHRMCLSFNHNDINGMCHLNDARKEEFPESYKHDDGFSYYDRLVSRIYGSVNTTTEAEKQNGCVSVSAESSTQDSQGSKWRLVFKGVAGTGIKLYELWTNTTWDSGSEDLCNYRNETLFNAWNDGRLNTKQVKLSLYDQTGVKVELVFNGADSDSLSWFTKERLESSPWSDLTTTASTNYFSIGGLKTENVERRFYISKNHIGCATDLGWLVVVDRKGRGCFWEASYSRFPVILYITNSNSISWQDAKDAGTLGMADYLTIHIDTE